MQQRCKAYEIRGPDRSRTAGAVRCHRNAQYTVTIDGRMFPLCAEHGAARWANHPLERGREPRDSAARPADDRLHPTTTQSPGYAEALASARSPLGKRSTTIVRTSPDGWR